MFVTKAKYNMLYEGLQALDKQLTETRLALATKKGEINKLLDTNDNLIKALESKSTVSRDNSERLIEAETVLVDAKQALDKYFQHYKIVGYHTSDDGKHITTSIV